MVGAAAKSTASFCRIGVSNRAALTRPLVRADHKSVPVHAGGLKRSFGVRVHFILHQRAPSPDERKLACVAVGVNRIGMIPCIKCQGEGRIFKSKYGGNDPDVWDAGKCEACGG